MRASIDSLNNKSRAFIHGLIGGIASMLVYLLIVVITAPALPPLAAINAAFKINSIIIIGMSIGVALQVFLSTYSKGLGCKLDIKRSVSAGNKGGTILSGFFSFFSLIPLGCCGTILYILSLLPSIVGSSITAVFIQYSQLLAYLGIAIIFGFNSIAIYKLRKQIP